MDEECEEDYDIAMNNNHNNINATQQIDEEQDIMMNDDSDIERMQNILTEKDGDQGIYFPMYYTAEPMKHILTDNAGNYNNHNHNNASSEITDIVSFHNPNHNNATLQISEIISMPKEDQVQFNHLDDIRVNNKLPQKILPVCDQTEFLKKQIDAVSVKEKGLVEVQEAKRSQKRAKANRMKSRLDGIFFFESEL